MMGLPIVDCRLPIERSRARGSFTRCRHNRGQIIRFLQERRQFANGYNSRLTEQLEPKCCFISFFLHCSNFSDEFHLASSAACGPIIRSDRSPTANNLIGNRAPCDIRFRNGPAQIDNSKCEVLGTQFQFNRVHGPKVSEQWPIANRQSPITL